MALDLLERRREDECGAGCQQAGGNRSAGRGLGCDGGARRGAFDLGGLRHHHRRLDRHRSRLRLRPGGCRGGWPLCSGGRRGLLDRRLPAGGRRCGGRLGGWHGLSLRRGTRLGRHSRQPGAIAEVREDREDEQSAKRRGAPFHLGHDAAQVVERIAQKMRGIAPRREPREDRDTGVDAVQPEAPDAQKADLDRRDVIEISGVDDGEESDGEDVGEDTRALPRRGHESEQEKVGRDAEGGDRDPRDVGVGAGVDRLAVGRLVLRAVGELDGLIAVQGVLVEAGQVQADRSARHKQGGQERQRPSAPRGGGPLGNRGLSNHRDPGHG